ncbi:hypothetical protein J7T55_010321 [Diaporthe amygdali]|uniref:uncharacterized protein n=1 Tax=Phomopsis amygdali TaxID=1214568 RepID=UPI0022FDB1FB|nr:uncharacterized protein J7T55_010321 [Diaporthe amygdali]KAJ0107714.1 hypothetical protein J7T55_010321 [Diaporthe amygdali]
MDPLSVSASIVGLLAAGAKITNAVTKAVMGVSNAPGLAKQILQEIDDITAALGFIQNYLHRRADASTERENLILLEHILITLTGCVTTYSDLQIKVDDLETSPNMGLLQKVQWWREESDIGALVGRLQNHKSSLTLMLTILQCPDLAAKIDGLEREGSIIAQSEAQSIASREHRSGALSGISLIAQNTRFSLRFSFDRDLETSRVYNNANKRDSMASTSSTALHATALSMFSKLSLSQLSNISFYALPIYSNDLSNSQCYIFGEEGALQSDTTAQPPSAPVPDPGWLPEQPTSSRRGYGTKLLGRYARRRPIISSPMDPVHVTHIVYSTDTQEFSGLPKEWKHIVKTEKVGVRDDPLEQQAFVISGQPVSSIQALESPATGDKNDHTPRHPSPGLTADEAFGSYSDEANTRDKRYGVIFVPHNE